MAELSLPVQKTIRAQTARRVGLESRPLRWPNGLGTWGLRLTALSYLAACVLVPVVVIVVEGFREGLGVLVGSVTRPSALHAIGLTLWTAAIMTVINVVMGTLTAYVMVNFKFLGKGLLNALIDLPFAIPTLVAGVMIVLLYGPQTVLGAFFQKQLGIQILYAPPGIVLALLFVSFPFVVRTVQPALRQLDPDHAEAAYTLGASTGYTFRRVIFPAIRPAMITGALLSFARALGEFGAIVIVAGNIPMKSQTAAVYIYGQVETPDMQAASSIAIVLLFVAFALTFGLDLWQARLKRRTLPAGTTVGGV